MSDVKLNYNVDDTLDNTLGSRRTIQRKQPFRINPNRVMKIK